MADRIDWTRFTVSAGGYTDKGEQPEYMGEVVDRPTRAELEREIERLKETELRTVWMACSCAGSDTCSCGAREFNAKANAAGRGEWIIEHNVGLYRSILAQKDTKIEELEARAERAEAELTRVAAERDELRRAILHADASTDMGEVSQRVCDAARELRSKLEGESDD